MAVSVAVFLLARAYFIFFTLITCFSTEKPMLCSVDSYTLYVGVETNDVYLEESYITYSLWVYENTKGIRIKNSTKSYFYIVLLLSGDIELCPGPNPRCNDCEKTV